MSVLTLYSRKSLCFYDRNDGSKTELKSSFPLRHIALCPLFQVEVICQFCTFSLSVLTIPKVVRRVASFLEIQSAEGRARFPASFGTFKTPSRGPVSLSCIWGCVTL